MTGWTHGKQNTLVPLPAIEEILFLKVKTAVNPQRILDFFMIKNGMEHRTSKFPTLLLTCNNEVFSIM
jgi:hypothetical protein